LSIVYQRVSARLQYMGGRQLLLGMRFAASARDDEVSLGTGPVCVDLEDLIFGRHTSSCDGLLPLALLDRVSMSRHAAEGIDIRHWALGQCVSIGECKALWRNRCLLRSQSSVAVEHSPFPHIDTAPQGVVGVRRRAWMCRGASLAGLRRRPMQDPGFGVPRLHQAVEKVAVGPAGSTKHRQNS